MPKTENVVFDVLEGEPDTNLIDDATLAKENNKEKVPARNDVEWSDYVMSLFAHDELVKQDRKFFPRVHGLRRLASKLLGNITSSTFECVQAPTVTNQGQIGITAFLCTIKFGNGQTFSDVGDVFWMNEEMCSNTFEYARFPSAIAATRAEARTLRKALGLNVCAAEELGPVVKNSPKIVPIKEVDPDTSTPSYIVTAQTNFIHINCQKLDINAWKLIDSTGENKYKSIKDITFGHADAITKILGELIRQKTNGKDAIKDYCKKNNLNDLGKFDPTWQNGPFTK